jgi:hypothetical protein
LPETENVMKKLFAALVAAGLAFGVGSAMARDTSAKPSAGDNATTQSQQNAGSEADERRNRDSTQQGEAVPGPGAGKHPTDSADTGAPVRTDKGTAPSANPGDPKDELRNRDSSKQQDPNAPPKQ